MPRASFPLLNPDRAFTLMGVVNVTPDSFSDGGRFLDHEAAIAHGLELRAEGADWVDVGGESSRPGSEPVAASEELRRILSVVEALAAQGVPVSVDTRRVDVARAALDAGAGLVNDITAFAEPGMAALVAERGACAVLMHMRGEPRTMQKNPVYDDVVEEVRAFLAQRLARALEAGVAPGRVALDPGIGFGKTLEHNVVLLSNLEHLREGLAAPLAIGVSRKAFLGTLTGAPVTDRLAGSLAAAIWAFTRGARIFRVHDVKATREALQVAQAVRPRATTALR